MNNLSIAGAIASALSVNSIGSPLFRIPNGPTRKVYPEDRAKMVANRAAAGERDLWNTAVETREEQKARANLRTFIPRKASHKQGWRLGHGSPF